MVLIETNTRSWEILGYTRKSLKNYAMTHPDDIKADVINKRLTLGLAPNFSVERDTYIKNKSIV
jgi:hypothetical protein